MAVAPPLLAALTNLADLGRLVRGLGLTPLWEPLAPEVLPCPVPRAAILGRRGSFEWLGIDGAGAADIARAMSVALAARGRAVGVLGIDGGARQLTVALCLERGASVTLSLDAPSRTALDRLQRLAQLDTEGGISYALRVLEILDGQDAGRRFFLAFRDTLNRMAGALPGTLTTGDRQTIALIQLTRVLFLYFVQAKGWLDGRPDFLRRAVDDALAQRRRLHRDLFRPLFFGTLNRQHDARGRARMFGRIPFLNGGLFEPHPLEIAWRGDVPTATWREAFDGLFERFHFTVHEGSTPGAIAPDMLGRVFEGLMAPATRRLSGAFYTPVRLVQRLVDAALTTWLAARLGWSHDRITAALEARDPLVIAPLRSITILDPAVGSGAFLLGALNRLSALRVGERPEAELRRQILEHNLFGVDISPMAVRLAELRLWLAVIAAEDTTIPEQVAPLPNLDGMVRQGDSLLDPVWFLGSLGATAGVEGPSLAALRHSFVAASGPAKREAQRRLRQAEVRALTECLQRAAHSVELAITDLLTEARSTSLFGERRGIDRTLRPALRRLRTRLSEIRRLLRRVAREGEVPWFVYASHFGDVLARGGFDLVVGNPPWVRAEELPSRVREQLSQRYRWWRATGRGYAHLPDLAVAFVERSLELLAPDGALGLLVPAKLATAGYGSLLRAELAERHTIETLASLAEDPGAVFEATTYPAALVVRKAAPRTTHVTQLGLVPIRGERVPQHRLRGGGPWMLAAPALFEVVEALRQRHPRLGERFTPQLGVKTGANAVFLEPPSEIEPALVRSALRGRDLHPFGHRTALRLLFPHDARGAPLPRLPAHAARYLRQHEALLRVRVDYHDGPPWTLFRVRPALAPHRVVWPDIARRLMATVLSGPGMHGVIPLNSCYLIAAPDHRLALALTGWLNCRWIGALARASADPARNGFARFSARVVADLPLPAEALTDARLVELTELALRGDPDQERLDAICAEHLALPPDARALLARATGDAPHHRR